jgi:hypothetical protein
MMSVNVLGGMPARLLAGCLALIGASAVLALVCVPRTQPSGSASPA